MIAEFHGNYILKVIRNRQTMFKSGHTILCTLEQFMSVPVVPLAHQHLVFSAYCKFNQYSMPFSDIVNSLIGPAQA